MMLELMHKGIMSSINNDYNSPKGITKYKTVYVEYCKRGGWQMVGTVTLHKKNTMCYFVAKFAPFRRLEIDAATPKTLICDSRDL